MEVSQQESHRRAPLVVLVTGLPGAGKTTLAERMAAELRLPLLSKDVVKERLWEVLGIPERDGSMRFGAAANEILWAQLRTCFGGAVVETWLDPTREDPGHARRGLLATGLSPIWEVCCECPIELAVARYRARQRHPGHLPADPETLDRLRRVAPLLAPLGLGPVIRVDTSGPVELGPILDQLMG